MAPTRPRRTVTTSSSSAAGGHGIATAFHLAADHGRGARSRCWSARRSAPATSDETRTIVRSNYMLPRPTRPFYEKSMQLWEGLERSINYNAMVSQRGVLNLFHSDAQRDAYARRGNAMLVAGIAAELLDRDRIRAMVPFLDFDNARFPHPGRPAATTRRHGPPRRRRLGATPGRRASGASTSSQNCEVTGISREGRSRGRRRDEPWIDPRPAG